MPTNARTTFKGDSEHIKASTCTGGDQASSLCLDGFGGALCARCDERNSFQLDRNKENIDYSNGCMECVGRMIESARLMVGLYAVVIVVVTVPIAYFNAEIHSMVKTYLPFILVIKARLEEVRDKAKVLLTYVQVMVCCLFLRPCLRVIFCVLRPLFVSKIISQYMDGVIDVRWPNVYNQIASRLAFVNLNLVAFVSATCAFKVGRDRRASIHA